MGRKATLYLFSSLFVLFTAALLVAAVVCHRASLQPLTCGWIVAGLAAPVVFGLNLCLLVWWLVRRRWLVALMPFAALAVGASDMALLLRLPRFGDVPEGDLRVATLNVHGFQQEQTRGLTARSVAAALQQERVDVVFLQEALDDAEHPFAELASRFEDYPYYVRELSMACFSRYPILDHQYVRFPDSNQSYLRVDMQVEGRPVRFVSVHLQSTGLSMARRRFRRDYGRGIPRDTLCRLLEENAAVRQEQIRTVRNVIDSTRMPLVVLGDFNDTPFSPAYRDMSRGLTDAFRTAGRGWGGTYRGLVRIDYILHNNGFEAVDCYVWRDKTLSDHDLVIAEVRFAR